MRKNISKTLILLSFLILTGSACSKNTSNQNIENQPNIDSNETSQSPNLTPEEVYSELVEITEEPHKREGSPVWAPSGWEPDGFQDTAVSKNACNPSELREYVILNNDPIKNSQLVSSYFSKCQLDWKTHNQKLSALLKFSAFQYEYEKTNQIKQVQIKLENNKIIRGLLALKPGSQKRPLIIAVCGVLCEAGDRVSQYLLAQLFDDTPFHLLVLSNSTTHQFLEDNNVSGFGGLIGADTVVRLARYFKNPKNEHFNKISSIQVFGISLGSHEATFSSILNTFHDETYGMKPISSFAAVCPVTDFQATFQSIFEAPVKSQIAKVGLKKLIKNTANKIGIIIPSEFDDDNSSPKSFISFLIDLYYKNFLKYQELFPPAPWSFPVLKNKEEIILASNLKNFANKVKDPMLLLASADDPVVITDLNSETLRDSSENSLIFPTKLSEGSHCALSVSYGWRNTSLVLQSYFLANDPKFASQLTKYRARFSDETQERIERLFDRTKKVIAYRWKINHKKKLADLILYFPRPNRPIACNNIDYEFQNVDCKMSLTISVSLSKFPEFIKSVVNKTEALAAERWLNVQVRLLDEDRNDISISRKVPVMSEYLEL